jgi:hypothetical protein
MTRAFTVWLLAFAACSCAASKSISPYDWHFAVQGRLASVSAADIAAVVAAMGPRKIYRLRVISRDRVEADTRPEQYTIVRREGDKPEVHSVECTAVTRQRGVWTAGEMFFTTF